MSNAPSKQPATPAEFTQAIAEGKYENRVQHWRQALIELEPKQIVDVMKKVRSQTTTLSDAGDAFYEAAKSCKDLIPIQRVSEIIALLLHENMRFPADQLAEMLKHRRVSAALTDIPLKATEDTKRQVEDLLRDVPGFGDQKDREYTRKNVALLLRLPSPIAQKVAELPPAALQKLDTIGNMVGASLVDFGKLPAQSWPLIQDSVSPETPKDRREAAANALRDQLKSLSA